MQVSAFHAQPGAPSVPTDLVLNDAEDYKDHQALCRKSLAWLLQTSMCEYEPKRNELNAFVLLWLSGSPEVWLEFDSKCMPFLEDNEELFYTFIHGMALYSLSHPHEESKTVLHAHGLEAIARIVRNSKCIKKTKILKDIVRADRKDQLEQFARNLCGT
jgi:hypothetical protein